MRVRMGLVKTVTAFVAALVVGMATSVAAVSPLAAPAAPGVPARAFRHPDASPLPPPAPAGGHDALPGLHLCERAGSGRIVASCEQEAARARAVHNWHGRARRSLELLTGFQPLPWAPFARRRPCMTGSFVAWGLWPGRSPARPSVARGPTWPIVSCLPAPPTRAPQTLERIKNGYTYLLPNICEELNAKYPGTDGAPKPLYGQCMALLSGMSQWGADVKHWWHFGCYKVEDYGAMELIQPCPTHAVCAKVRGAQRSASRGQPPPPRRQHAGGATGFPCRLPRRWPSCFVHRVAPRPCSSHRTASASAVGRCLSQPRPAGTPLNLPSRPPRLAFRVPADHGPEQGALLRVAQVRF